VRVHGFFRALADEPLKALPVGSATRIPAPGSRPARLLSASLGRRSRIRVRRSCLSEHPIHPGRFHDGLPVRRADRTIHQIVGFISFDDVGEDVSKITGVSACSIDRCRLSGGEARVRRCRFCESLLPQYAQRERVLRCNCVMAARVSLSGPNHTFERSAGSTLFSPASPSIA